MEIKTTVLGSAGTRSMTYAATLLPSQIYVDAQGRMVVGHLVYALMMQPPRPHGLAPGHEHWTLDSYFCCRACMQAANTP